MKKTFTAATLILLCLVPALRAQDAIDFKAPDDIDFRTADIISEGTRMAAEVFSPRDAGKKLPTVIMSHGWGGTAQALRPDAVVFARAGFLVVAFDYRGWGNSDARLIASGKPTAQDGKLTAEVVEVRGVVDPIDQTTDIMNALHWVQSEELCDRDHIGIWGSSFSGGHVVYVAARDPRVKAFVSQVGSLDARWAIDNPQLRQYVFQQGTARTRGQIGYPEPFANFNNMRGLPVWEKLMRYAPIEDIDRCENCAKLFIIAENEELFDNKDHAIAAFERATGVKKLVTVAGIKHYGIYREKRAEAQQLAIDWFREHLGEKAPITKAGAKTNAENVADDWPGWLGPKRDGWVSSFQPPKRWPEQLQPQWQFEVGIGYGSPLVAAGRVYQHARQGDDEVVWCLDLKTGDEVWRQSYNVPFKMGGGGERHGKGPKSSPALADGRLLTMSITGVLSAWDAASGKPLWRREYDSQFGKSHPYWGASTSPLVDGGRVIVHFGTDEQGALVALDVESGQEVWRHGNDGPSYSSPIVVEIQGERQIVEWNHRALVGVDSETGEFLWEYPFPHVGSDQNMPTPVFHNGRVLLGGENRGIHCLEPELIDGGWQVKERWHQNEVALDMSTAVVNGDLLYGFSHYGQGRLFCLECETGKVLWQGPARTGDNAMLLAIPDHIVALISSGELKVIKAMGDRFESAASYRVAENDTWAPPVLLEDGILVKGRETLTRWGLVLHH